MKGQLEGEEHDVSAYCLAFGQNAPLYSLQCYELTVPLILDCVSDLHDHTSTRGESGCLMPKTSVRLLQQIQGKLPQSMCVLDRVQLQRTVHLELPSLPVDVLVT